MASIDELKLRVDLHDLADWLGLKRGPGGAKANYFRPGADEKNPSLSIYAGKNGPAFKDHAAGKGGSCVDLVQHVRGCDVGEAIRVLHDFLGIKPERPGADEPKRELTRAEYIAERCFGGQDRAMEYLQGRGIPTAVIRHALDHKTVGFNDWHSSKAAAGEVGYGGPAVAFIVRSLNPGHVAAVDMRYLDPALNGGVKTTCQGEKHGYGWTSDPRRLRDAQKVYVVESPINALSIEAAGIPYSAAFATRGVSAVEAINWRAFAGKQIILCFDKDKPDQKGRCAGQETAWLMHEILTGLDISALMVDQRDWTWNDVNDLLKEKGLEELKTALAKIEDCLIPGLPVFDSKAAPASAGTKRRVYLPWHDFTEYARYSVRPDFMSFVQKKTDENGEERIEHKNLAGFRVAGLSRVTIASARSTMSGDPDDQPKVMFAVSVQAPRHGARLLRKVLDDDKLHNIDVWNRFGPVFLQSQFRRMVNILERTADIGSRKAVNFVGLAWRDGRLIVNQGSDCYFTDPDKQCPYHNLSFPSGTRADARRVVLAYRGTFKRNAASMLLVWGLGGHLKALLGFWPHMMMQAAKGMGKSTLTKHLERTLAMTMYSGQSLQTEFRLLTSISHTSHPVGWEELSARHQLVIDKAVSLLQECYQFTTTARGSEMTQYLLCAPVLLAGEDVPVRSLIGKLVATQLTGKKGDLLPYDLPRFPVRQWLEFLAGFKREQVIELFEAQSQRCLAASRASGADDGAVRMAKNYAAMLVAWRLLCEFTELDPAEGQFMPDLIGQMNTHIAETSGDREPWVWILETLLSEIATNNFRHPYAWDEVKDEEGARVDCLLVRTSHVMDHLAGTMALRDKWNSLPVKSDRVLKAELKHAGVVVRDDIERTIGADKNTGAVGRRVSHMSALSVERMEKFGLYAVRPGFDERNAAPVYGQHK